MPRFTPAEARWAFTFALETLSEVDRSPLKRLREEFYPEWRTSVLGPDRGDGRYTSLAQREELAATAPVVAERWASACKLLKPGSRSAPAWLIDYAVEYLTKLPAVSLVSEQPLAGKPQPCLRAPRQVDPAGLFLPMPHPEPFPGEAWLKYRKRVCRVLRAHWDATRNGSRRQKKPVALKIRPSFITRIEHAQWFILYQCCGWKLAKIAACTWYQRRGSGEQAIWQGLTHFAERTGSKVSAKRRGLKKSAR
jgi:hypothetical protein